MDTPNFRALWASAQVRPQWEARVNTARDKLLKMKHRYGAIANEFHMPWQIIAVIDYMESGGGCRCHLHNGDPLDRRTHNVPVNRPRGNPPFTWEESARDALKYDGVDKVPVWSLEATLDFLERYNGLGYRKKGINSPYLWSGTTAYGPPENRAGKYVRDGVFDENAISQQVGCVALLKVLEWAPDGEPAPLPHPLP